MYIGQKFAITTESYLASRTGYDVYKRGGNAVDALTAASIVLTYTLPHLGGVGGDFLALVSEDGNVKVVMGLGWAPTNVPQRPPERGLQSAVVPGYLAGIYEMHSRYGALKWEEVVKTAVEAMEEATLHPSFAEALQRYRTLLAADRGGRIYLQLPTEAGSPYRIEPLLRLWRRLMENPMAFYDEVAKDFEKLGHFTTDDFSKFKAEVRDPLALKLGDFYIYEAPPPSLGFAVLLAVKLSTPGDSPLGLARMRSIVEALKKAHWARDRYLHDGPVPVEEILDGKIPLGEANRPEPTYDTTYLAAVDRDFVVSAIQSLYYPFGSGVTEPTWGITLNNRASCFTTGLNKAEPRKRPANTLSAVIMRKEDSTYALGASAGHYRPAIYTQLIQNIAVYNMDIKNAVWSPRFIWTGGEQVRAEEGWEKGPGVEIVKYPSRLGVASAAYTDGKKAAAVADIRGDGIAIGL